MGYAGQGTGFGYRSYRTISASAFLLDQITGIILAYALTKLSSTYTGPCLNVRRSSDNATQNIGFVGNDLDISSLLSFVGSGNGYVHTWYDQSGGSYNMTQSTVAYQPQIVFSGSLNASGLYFNGSSSYMTNSYAAIYNNIGAATRLNVINYPDNDAYAVGKGGYEEWGIDVFAPSSIKQIRFSTNDTSPNDLNNTNTNTSVKETILCWYDGSNAYSRVNGIQVSQSRMGSIKSNSNPYSIGQNVNCFYNGYMDFTIIKNAGFTTSEVKTIESFF